MTCEIITSLKKTLINLYINILEKNWIINRNINLKFYNGKLSYI